MQALLSSSSFAAGAVAPASSLQCPRSYLPSCSAGISRHGWLVGGSSSRRFFTSSSRSPSSSNLRSRPTAITTTTISCKVPSITQDSFSDEVLKSDSPVLVGFCAEWCGPCKLIGPIMDSVAKEFNGSLKAVKIDTDSSPDLVKEYDVYGLPTLILFKDGKEVPKSRREGTINAKKLKELLSELLTTTATHDI